MSVSVSNSSSSPPFNFYKYITSSLQITFRIVQLSAIFIPTLLILPSFYLAERCFSYFNYTPSFWLHGLKWSIELCGPTFIKLGQYASCRPDILPASLCNILLLLRDHVHPHSLSSTRAAILHTFDAELEDLFLEFDTTPLGTGAIAQVHRAVLRPDYTSTNQPIECAVKILHPHVASMIHTDLQIIHWFACIIDSWIPNAQFLSLPDEISTFSNTMHRQLDLVAEAVSLSRFSDNFAKTSPKTHLPVLFPSPIETNLVSHKNPRVLLESYVCAMPLSKVMEMGDATPNGVVREIMQATLATYVQMVGVDNFVHVDMHPGNVFVGFESETAVLEGSVISALRKVESQRVWENAIRRLVDTGFRPRLVILDAGLVEELEEAPRKTVMQLFFALATGFNGQQIGEILADQSTEKFSDVQPDREKFIRGIVNVVDGIKVREKEGGFDLSQLQLGKIMGHIFSLARECRVKLDGSFASVVVGLMVVEGLALSLSKNAGETRVDFL
ncbi:hypothetical protein HK096_007326, partial [Nowakowskiella sp. JEL0078]